MGNNQFLINLACPVIPIVVFERIEHAVPVAEALFCGGISALEVTLRTDVGCEAISVIKSRIPNMVVGAGTVCSDLSFQSAVDSGSDFVVSPGATERLFKAAANREVPFLPGVVTGSEILMAMEYGHRILKFFPAEASGGVTALRALAGPFPEAAFIPTGGITRDNLEGYLRLNNVQAVGGSWLTPRDLMREQQWEEIYLLAQEAVAKSRVAKVEV